MIVCGVQIQNDLEEAGSKELAVCVDKVCSCIQITMKSLQHAFNVPEIKAALSEWHDKEGELERLIQKCKSKQEAANDQLDIDAAQTLYLKQNELNRKLWELVRCKLERINREEGVGQAHFPLANEESKDDHTKDLLNIVMQHDTLAAQCTGSLEAIQ